jgi:hypothetical protein
VKYQCHSLASGNTMPQIASSPCMPSETTRRRACSTSCLPCLPHDGHMTSHALPVVHLLSECHSTAFWAHSEVPQSPKLLQPEARLGRLAISGAVTISVANPGQVVFMTMKTLVAARACISTLVPFSSPALINSHAVTANASLHCTRYYSVDSVKHTTVMSCA